jgi:hypothetical protein
VLPYRYAGRLAAPEEKGRQYSSERVAVSEQGRAFERVRESFVKQGLMGLLGAKVNKVGEGRRVLELPYNEELTQQQCCFRVQGRGGRRTRPG